MEFAELRDFRQSLNALYRRGGRYQKAATDVHALLGRISTEETPLAGLRRTKHGENRIKHCVKYDLNDFCRLITIQTNGFCILLFCGDHDDSDCWLENNRGLVPVVQKDRTATATFQSTDQGAADEVKRKGSPAVGFLYERLPELFDQLTAPLPRKLVREIEQLDASASEGRLWTVVNAVDETKLRVALHDVLALLRDDRVGEATARAKLFFGAVTALDAVPAVELPEIVDSDVLRRIPRASPQYSEAANRFMKTARYRDWMMFMHPEQEAIVEAEFDGPAKLAGVSGSGKTCVVVQRAVRLASKYVSGKVLILTLNRALARLIDDLVTTCSPPSVRERIVVRPFFEQCRELMLVFDPSGRRLYDEVTWKTNEHVDEIWQEYYRCEFNNLDAQVLQEVHDHLLARSWNPERYLREEVDWLRSALRPAARQQYLDMARIGRTVGLARQYRERVLAGTTGWEEKMSVVGVIDTLGLAQRLVALIDRIKPEYRCVLVDEVQDFGNVELDIVRALVRPDENDLFLCGDAAQAVTTKYQLMKEVGINIPTTRSRKLSLNYRNSRDVLRAAYETLKESMTVEMIDRDDFEILDPELSALSGSAPLLLEAPNLETELRGALTLAREFLETKAEAKACIAICGYSLYELTKFGQAVSLPVLDGSVSIDAGALFLSDLEQTKGFEFDLMVIVNCSGGVIPDASAPDEERYRDLSRLYVAMTRAKTDLVLSFTGTPSPFVVAARDEFLEESWRKYVDLSKTAPVILTQHLEAYREGMQQEHWRQMAAEEFLYSGLALGVSTDLSAKMRALVDGQGLKKGGSFLKWRNLGSASESFKGSVQARSLWGPEVGRQFATLVSRLEKPNAGSETTQ